MKKKNENTSTGEKIAALRAKKKMTLEELSSKTGIALLHLRNIEEGKDFVPVGDILKISRSLTVNPDELLQTDTGNERELKKKRIQDFRKREKDYNYTVLTPEGKDKHLRAFKVVIPPKSEHPKVSYQHEGEEFDFVLSGEVEITVGEKVHRLKENEYLSFDSSIKHSLRNPGTGETVLIVAIYNP